MQWRISRQVSLPPYQRDSGASLRADLFLEQYLWQLEMQLLQPEARKSAVNIAALLVNDFLEIGSSGRMFNKKQIIEELQSESSGCHSLVDFKVTVLAQDVTLATYRAIRHGASGEQAVYSLHSSIWKLIDDRWQMVFHQGTLSKV